MCDRSSTFDLKDNLGTKFQRIDYGTPDDIGGQLRLLGFPRPTRTKAGDEENNQELTEKRDKKKTLQFRVTSAMEQKKFLATCPTLVRALSRPFGGSLLLGSLLTALNVLHLRRPRCATKQEKLAV